MDSDGSPASDARFSFLSAAPAEVRRIEAGDPEAVLGMVARLGLPEAGSGEAAGSGLEIARDESAIPHWIGYIAYDACAAPSLSSGHELGHFRSPGICFARYPALFVFDHREGRNFVAGDDEPTCLSLLELAAIAAGSGEPIGSPSPIAPVKVGPVSASDPAEHARAIAEALELIARGDLYQVNLARKLTAKFEGPPIALALAMRHESPVPLGMFFDDGQRAVVARSMERFLRWKRPSGRLHTRPIKGTKPRAQEQPGSESDASEQKALVADPKEQAEHAMIVDLMRNDLSRVAAIGSVKVVEAFKVEPFARLHHLVSTIACKTRPEVTASEVLRATFPPGSVTGTPKLKAIETIKALEPEPRGIYTGALGFIDRLGGLSLAVAIRTAVIEKGVASYFAGGGIVEASNIAREIEETDLKARVFTDAIKSLSER